MEVLNDILGYKNRKIYQDTSYMSFSLDSVMLANFVNINLRDKNILDLGTGNGVIPLILSLKTTSKIVGVELQDKLAKLAIKSVNYNKLDKQIEIINKNMKDYARDSESDIFDVITCNPPYFKVQEKSPLSTGKEKLIARHEVEITLEEIVVIARKLLKNGGRLAIVNRCDRLLEILDLFRTNNIEPKRIKFIYDTKKEATLFFIEGSKNGKVGLKVEEPLLVKNTDGSFTTTYRELLKEVKNEAK